MRKLFAVLTLSVSLISPLFPVEELDNATPEYIEQTYQKALELFNKQDYEGSLDQIRHVIKSDMQNYKLRYLAAHNHWKLGNFESASAHFQTAIAVESLKPEAAIDYSLMLIHQRKYRTVYQVLNAMVYRLNKNKITVPAKIYNIYARTALLEGNISKALNYSVEAKAAFDSHGTGIKDKIEAMTLEGRAHLASGNFEKAAFALQWALSLREKNPYLLNLLGFTYQSWMETQPAESELHNELRKKSLEYYEAALDNELADGFASLVKSNIEELK